MGAREAVAIGLVGLAVVAAIAVAIINNITKPNPNAPPTRKQQQEEAIQKGEAPPAKDEDGPKVAGQAQGSGGDAGGCPPGYVTVDTGAFPAGHDPFATVAFTGATTSLRAQADQYQYDQTEPPAAPQKSSGCKANTTKGTNKADTIEGTKKADLILGGAGDDKIEAGLGNDRVEGGPGKDTINAGLGNNTIQAGPDNDTVHTIVIWHEKKPWRMVFLKQRTKCGPGLDDVLVYHRRVKAGYNKYFGNIADVRSLRSKVIHPPDCENVKPPPKKPSRIKPKDRPEG
jgi:RTX calcium-binding nonapeptide repeat (4 copies)